LGSREISDFQWKAELGVGYLRGWLNRRNLTTESTETTERNTTVVLKDTGQVPWRLGGVGRVCGWLVPVLDSRFWIAQRRKTVSRPFDCAQGRLRSQRVPR